jgi:hypothetical protein
MIVGHTPQASGHPESRCDETLLQIDSGMSSFFGGGLSVTVLGTDGQILTWLPGK